MSNQVLKILIAEDDPSILHLSRVTLAKEGFSVLTCTNGEDAILQIKQNELDLVILDETMPKANGTIVAHFIRENENTKYIPVILITAENNPTHFNDLLKTGLINLFLPKPFSPTLLLNMIYFLLKSKDAAKK
ncbi:MAG: response regulator [Acidobacteriota bacterium]